MRAIRAGALWLAHSVSQRFPDGDRGYDCAREFHRQHLANSCSRSTGCPRTAFFISNRSGDFNAIREERAARLIESAEALIIAVGAGMGIDPGLPDFRGNDGF